MSEPGSGLFEEFIRFDRRMTSLVGNEGLKTWMYLDSKGYVTIGIGNLIPNVNAAKVLDFVTRGTGAPASLAAKEKAYNDLENAGKKITDYSKYSAEYYRKFTDLELPEKKVYELFRDRISKEFIPMLKKRFSRFFTFPAEAQAALVMLIFKYGPGGFDKYKSILKKDVEREDWFAAVAHGLTGRKETRILLENLWITADLRKGLKVDPVIVNPVPAALKLKSQWPGIGGDPGEKVIIEVLDYEKRGEE